jgi:PKD repeat protein
MMKMPTRPCLLALLVVSAGCTMQETPIPQLAGPSELALRIAMQISPDSILQDGASQAVLNIEAANFDGRAARGLTLRIETTLDGVIQDFGTLSTKTVVTGDDGRARITYTAPPRPAEPVDQFNIVTFLVTPVGTDFRGETSRTVDLRLVTPGVLQPPNPGAPVPQFTFSPTTPAIMSNVVFDASTTEDDGALCGSRCTFTWDFGDGEAGSGVFANHQFRTPGTFQVRLTVRDSRGASASIAQAVTVGGGTAPTAAFSFSPTAPAPGQIINFTAEASRAAAGRRIVSYEWNFGSGRFGSGVAVTKGYETPGTYTVTLTVTDDAGLQGTTQQTVTVGGTGTSGLTAALVFSPTAGTTATNFFFDASGSRGLSGSPIVEYRFTWGDATPDTVGTSPTATHQFSTPGTYVVSVTVRDSASRTSTARVNVAVSAPTP